MMESNDHRLWPELQESGPPSKRDLQRTDQELGRVLVQDQLIDKFTRR